MKRCIEGGMNKWSDGYWSGFKRWMENLFDIKGVIIIYFQLLPGHKDPDQSDPILRTTFRQESLRMTPELCARLSWGKTMTFARQRYIVPFLTAWELSPG
jgi:hypothetical protein